MHLKPALLQSCRKKRCVLNEDIKRRRQNNIRQLTLQVWVDVVLKRRMDHNNVGFDCEPRERGKWTHYTHFTGEMSARSDFIIRHRSPTDFMHRHAFCILAVPARRFWNISAQSIKQFLGGDMRGISRSRPPSSASVCSIRRLHIGGKSSMKWAWGVSMSGADKKVYLAELSNWTTILLEIMTCFSECLGRFTDISGLVSLSPIRRTFQFSYFVFASSSYTLDIWCAFLTTPAEATEPNRLISSIITSAIYTEEIIKVT